MNQIKPTYYVCHPGGNYSIADPQPVAIEQAEKQEPVAKAWAEGYRAGIDDERTSQDNIGIAGLGMKVAPARENPYQSHPPTAAPAQPLKTDGIVGWRWIATCGSGAYQLRSDEPMRGYSYKAPVYEVLPAAPAQQPLTEAQINVI